MTSTFSKQPKTYETETILSSSPPSKISEDQLEDIYKNEIIMAVERDEHKFIDFAKSDKGLNLDASDITSIVKDSSTNLTESQKMEMLRLWRAKITPKHPIDEIRERVRKFHGIGQDPKDFVNLSNGDFGVYRSSKDMQGRVFLGRAYGGRLCSVRLVEPEDHNALKVVKTLIDKKHENVVSIFHAGDYRTELIKYIYVAMELTRKKTLRDVYNEIKESQLPFALLTNLAKQMLDALVFIHDNGIIYNNLAPEYILMSDDNEQIKLCNFDLSKMANKDPNIAVPVTYVGVDGYQGPEVYRSQVMYQKSDIFSAGIVLAELFTDGKHPYGEDRDLWRCNIKSEEPDLRDLITANRKAEKDIITRMLDPNQKKRPTSIEVSGDIGFLQYSPYEDVEISGEQAYNIIQCKIVRCDSEEIIQWELDKDGNLTKLDQLQNVADDVEGHGIEHVAICDDQDIPSTTTTDKDYIIEFSGDVSVNLLKSFYEKMNSEVKIIKLIVSYQDSILALMEMICSIVGKWKIMSLSLEYDDMDKEVIQLLQCCLKKNEIGQLKELDISYNKNISSGGYKLVGEITREFSIETLSAIDCDITYKKLKKLLSGVKDSKLKHLDVGCNADLTRDGYARLAEFVSSKNLESLKLSACELTEESIDEFYENLPSENSEQLLEELDVSHNPGIFPSASIGPLIVRCGIKKLNLAGCKLNEEHIIQMKESTSKHEMDTMCVRDNFTIGGGLIEIAKLVEQCGLKELDIGDCMLSASQLSAFKQKLKKTRLQRLHLGDESREPDDYYMEEIWRLLWNVEDVLYLQYYKLSSASRQELWKHFAKCATLVSVKLLSSDGPIEEWKKYKA